MCFLSRSLSFSLLIYLNPDTVLLPCLIPPSRSDALLLLGLSALVIYFLGTLKICTLHQKLTLRSLWPSLILALDNRS